MNVDEQLLERIVASVIGRLRGELPPAATVPPASPAALTPPAASAPRNGHTVSHLSDAVITAELLQSRLHGDAVISIGHTSILTPSARDYLRERQIAWTRTGIPVSSQSNVGRWLAIVVQSTPSVRTVLDDVARSQPGCWRRELVGLPREAVQLAVSAVCRAEAEGVVVFALQAERIACQGNRHPRVRAAVATDTAAMDAVKQSLGANLLVFNPTGRSSLELRNLLRAFTAGGPPRTPADWDRN